MSKTQKNPQTDDHTEEAQGKTPGAHGDENGDDRSGALGVSHTRKDPDEIAPNAGKNDG